MARRSRANPATLGASSEFTKPVANERSFLDAGVRNHEIWLIHAVFAEPQDVDVDRPRAPAPRTHASAVALDRLCRAQQAARRAVPLDLEHLVEKARLVEHTPWLRLDHGALPENARALLAQAPARGAELASAPS